MVRRAFTMVEVIVSVAVVFLLMGLLIAGLTLAGRGGRRAAEEHNVSALDMGVQQFRADFGTLPPMVKDAAPVLGANASVYSFSAAAANALERDFLRGEGIDPDAAPGDLRFSTRSLAYYLLGSLGETFDHVEGPGLIGAAADGSFRLSGKKMPEPLVDVSSGGFTLVSEDASKGLIELQDRNGVGYRYYRWMRGKPGQVSDAVALIEETNVPVLVGDPREDVNLRSADYAIVAAGPNRVFGDLGTEGADYIKQQLGISLGKPDEVAKSKGRSDNVVRSGR